MSVVYIPLDTNSFVGNSGKNYIIYPTLSAKRFEVFESMQVEMELSVSLTGFRKESLATYDLMNQGKFADASVKLHNTIHGVERIINKQPHPVLLMCALFICDETENQGLWNEADAQAKIEDWANVDIAFFLGSARRLVARFMGASNLDSQIFLEEVPNEEG